MIDAAVGAVAPAVQAVWRLANAICEPMIATLRGELPGPVLIVNEHRLRRVLTEYPSPLQHRLVPGLGQLALAKLTPGHRGSTSLSFSSPQDGPAACRRRRDLVPSPTSQK